MFFVEFVQCVHCASQATGSKIAAVLEASATIVASLVIAFIYGWKLALVILAFLPVMVLAGKVQGRAVAGSAKSGKSHLQEVGKVRKLVCVSLFGSAALSFFVSSGPSERLSVCMSVCLPVCLSVSRMSVCFCLSL